MALPRCSIVIPVHNKAALTRQCLDEILARPGEVPFEIVVVDDASTDATPELLDGYGEAIRVVRIDRNAGFATACNTGAAAGSAEFLLFLNNDTVPQDGWLDTLVAYADEHPEATVAGSKLLFPDGSIQHAGVVFDLSGDPLHIYAGFPADHPAVNWSRRFQAVTAACLLVDRKAFFDVDGFDTGYHNDLEDVDLCLRLGEQGAEVHYCHKSVLFHLESASRGYSYDPGPSARLYRKHWRKRVRHDELDYYLEDGLLDILRVSPELIRADQTRRQRDASLLQERSAQLSGLLRESLRISTLKAAGTNGNGELRAAGEIVGARKAGSRIAGRARHRLERQVLALRRDLEAAVGGHDPSPQAKPPEPPMPAGLTGYPRVVADVQRAVSRRVPRDSTVLVVSRGDDALLKLDGPHGWHFPRAKDGRWRGYYPLTSGDAIAHLEELRSQGADHIAFPALYQWWLDFYTGFARHLARYRRVDDEEGCLIFDLRTPVSDEAESPDSQEPGSEAVGDDSKSPRVQMSAGEYDALVERTRAAVNATAPPGATVLVISRGDDALLELDDRRAWHFPRGEGGDYRGYYPKTDEEAIEHLEDLRAAGAGYVVFPSSSFWWLDYYDSFAAHLRSRYLLVHQDDACIVFSLAEPLVAEVVESLLPADAEVAVLSQSGDLAGIDPEHASRLEPAALADEAIVRLRGLVAGGAEFLVVSRSAFEWLEEHPDFSAHLRAEHRFVTRQLHACEIWELRGSRTEPQPASPRGGWRGLVDLVRRRGRGTRRDG